MPMRVVHTLAHLGARGRRRRALRRRIRAGSRASGGGRRAVVIGACTAPHAAC